LSFNPYLDVAAIVEASVGIPGDKVASALQIHGLYLIIIGSKVDAQGLLSDGDSGTEGSVGVEAEVVRSGCLSEGSLCVH